jgi:hypothetical protein
MLRDAGTEINDEIAMNTPLLGQTIGNTGSTENGIISLHGGFLPGGPILTQFPNADFTRPGYQIARIKVEAVPIPVPGSLSLLVLGIGLVRKRRLLGRV